MNDDPYGYPDPDGQERAKPDYWPATSGPEKITQILERGSPWEIPKENHAVWQGAARKYLQRDHPEDAKARVRGVWLEGRTLPAWQKFTPVPSNLRAGIGFTTTRSHQEGPVTVVDEARVLEVSVDEDPFG